MSHVAEHRSSEVKEPSSTILPRIAAGESSAVEECLDAYGGLVWSIVRKYCRQSQEAEDAAQEIFVEIWRSVHRFDPAKGSEVNFIAVIARRRMIDRLRRRTTDQPEEVVELDQLTTNSGSAENAVLVAEEAAQAEECLEKLRDDEQSVIRLAVCEGLSHTTIANQLALSLGTVKSHARRGLIKLRDCMKFHSFGISQD